MLYFTHNFRFNLKCIHLRSQTTKINNNNIHKNTLCKNYRKTLGSIHCIYLLCGLAMNAAKTVIVASTVNAPYSVDIVCTVNVVNVVNGGGKWPHHFLSAKRSLHSKFNPCSKFGTCSKLLHTVSATKAANNGSRQPHQYLLMKNGYHAANFTSCSRGTNSLHR